MILNAQKIKQKSNRKHKVNSHSDKGCFQLSESKCNYQRSKSFRYSDKKELPRAKY